MSMLEGLVAIVTGAGRGVGAEHAKLLARHGATVVVNDVGSAPGGEKTGDRPADQVVSEISSLGGRASSNADDVAEPAGAERLVEQAVDEHGRLDILVNNAGVLRDRVIVNLTDEDWDVVVKVNLRGAFLPIRAAARHWRSRTKSRQTVAASVVNTSSESGVFANPGQANYAAAKSAVATLTQVAAPELARYGVRVNAILPRARTRLTVGTFGEDRFAATPGEFDRWDPANVAPFVTYLSSPSCALSGEVFLVAGSRVQRVRPWTLDDDWVVKTDGRWTVEALRSAVEELTNPA
jgi:NAD(P)-dependent dehydrogenase (short-subunit alcohol dehydrogenase family)